MIIHYQMSAEEISSSLELVQELSKSYATVEVDDLLPDLNVFAHELPRSVREFLNSFRLSDGGSGVAILSGYPIEQDKVGPTPSHWDHPTNVSSTRHEDLFFMLCGALLGDVFAWGTQQGGHLVHDVLPIKGQEHEQMGGSSTETLYWHTEDAFHPYRADHVGLMCLRNPAHIQTTVGAFEPDEIDEENLDILFQPRFTIHTDKSHTPEYRAQKSTGRKISKNELDTAYLNRQTTEKEPPKTAILSGSRRQPNLCIDPVYMDDLSTDPQAKRALKALQDAIEHNLEGISLAPGEILFLDNSRVVHGRSSFSARYDGTDRWLKRINLTRDLPKSRDARGGMSKRLIF